MTKFACTLFVFLLIVAWQSSAESADHKPLATAPASGWHAACEEGHAYWSGPVRSTYQLARKDGSEHDIAKHGGVESALILPQ